MWHEDAYLEPRFCVLSDHVDWILCCFEALDRIKGVAWKISSVMIEYLYGECYLLASNVSCPASCSPH